MAQEVRIAGVTYQDVPAISVPDSNGVYHLFVDAIDGNSIGYGLTDGTLPLVGVGQADYAVI